MAKTFFGKIIVAFGDFFKHIAEELFNSAEKAFKALPPVTQQQIIDGSALMSLIGQTLDEAPADVVAAINETFPHIGNDDLVKSLETLISAWDLTPVNNDIDNLIAIIQKKLKPKEGTIWDSLMNEGASLLAAYLSGDNLFQVIIMLMQWVFEKYVQGKILPVKKDS